MANSVDDFIIYQEHISWIAIVIYYKVIRSNFIVAYFTEGGGGGEERVLTYLINIMDEYVEQVNNQKDSFLSVNFGLKYAKE